jgi:thymidylate kinase
MGIAHGMNAMHQLHILLTIFNRLDLQPSLKMESDRKMALRLYMINNPDGSPRWAWPVDNRQPEFLRFYSDLNWKSRLFIMVIRLLFKLKLQRIIARHQATIYFSKTDLLKLGAKVGNDWALFTGTIGPGQKAIFCNRHEFIKIPIGIRAKQFLDHEKQVLQEIPQGLTYYVPSVVGHTNNQVLLSTYSGEQKRETWLSDLHWTTLTELAKSTSTFGKIADQNWWKEILVNLLHLEHHKDPRIPAGLLRKLKLLAHSIDTHKIVAMSRAHGDFTPWNMYCDQGRLYIYDWELSHASLPMHFDAIHFVMQTGILVKRKNYARISTLLDCQLHRPEAQVLNDKYAIDTALHFQLYLLYQVTKYLGIYAVQPQWHTQVDWLLNTWNQAISEVLNDLEILSQRQLLAMDVFDVIQRNDYAALKWNGLLPEQLQETSDIDLAVSKTTKHILERFITEHIFVDMVRAKQKSFMSQVTISLKSGEILFLDLITQFKRKQTEMFPVKDMLATSSLNSIGVKEPEDLWNELFIHLFYKLNRQDVPEKYQKRYTSTGTYNMGQPAYVNQLLQKKETAILEKNLLQLPWNRGLSRLLNVMRYGLDTMRNMIAQKGFIVTFSGVDGAGKSTIIEEVKQQLEKKLRKRVVVLRHRPGILPIISAWRHGKTKAEAISVSNLPRTGTNHSFTSSLFRFSYYYTDYLFGQFYVYFRYVLQGYVVVYDRYYFDFIQDARRSNISLPKGLIKWCYNMLMKPRLNFFLYADPDVILQRKQELNKSTIQQLTTSYRSMFRKLNVRSKRANYITLENVQIQRTLQSIMQYIQRLA